MPPDRRLAPSPFPGDDGSADPDTRAALKAAAAGDLTPYLSAVATLCLSRILVPVVATATEVALTETAATGPGGLAVDKESELAVVLLRDQQGRRAMLAFTGMDSLAAWDQAARPVAVTLDVAAAAALADGATTLLIDLAGPDPLTIEDDLLRQLAAGTRLVAFGDGEFGWARVDPGRGSAPSPSHG